ncbi:hypothetical protein KEM48_000599 [Puccinia striiformis f. sp. tritici PST-130]|nr:hypothetical protein KEM48_000599 [Puccinia striiformis f. sp. tritici PST-130]
MAQESEPAPICEALRSFLTNLRIETAEAFFAGDEKKIKKRLLQLGPEVLDSDEDWRRRVLALNAFAHPRDTHRALNAYTSHITDPVEDWHHVRPYQSFDQAYGLLPTLRRELNELLYTEVPGLMEHFLDARHIDPTHRKRSYKDFIEKKGKEILPHTKQHSMMKYISSFAERLTNQQRPEIPMSRIWRTQPNTRLEGVEGTRRVDGAIMSKVNTNEETYHIRDVLVPFELKKDKEEVNKAVICLGRYVCEVFKAQPTRRFVVGVTVFETSIQIWQFDRSGAIGSEPFDFKSKEPNIEKFLDLMLCFFTCNQKLLGFDPTFLEAHDLPTVIRIQTRDDQEFEIDPKPVFERRESPDVAPPAGKRIFLEIRVRNF